MAWHVRCVPSCSRDTTAKGTSRFRGCVPAPSPARRPPLALQSGGRQCSGPHAAAPGLPSLPPRLFYDLPRKRKEIADGLSFSLSGLKLGLRLKSIKVN